MYVTPPGRMLRQANPGNSPSPSALPPRPDNAWVLSQPSHRRNHAEIPRTCQARAVRRPLSRRRNRGSMPKAKSRRRFEKWALPSVKPKHFEDMTVDLAKIAIATGAVRLDEEDGETLLTRCNANAERHAYARLTDSSASAVAGPSASPMSKMRCTIYLDGSKICEPPRARERLRYGDCSTTASRNCR